MYDFPFNISDISYLLNLTVRLKTDFAEQVDCPFCNGHGKMRLDISKNQFRCPKCDESGGMLKLYALMMNVDTKGAYKEICETLKVSHISKDIVRTNKNNSRSINNPCTVINKKADEMTVHNTYSNLLSILTLSDVHRKKLVERGLDDKQIRNLGYKSITKNSITNISSILIERGCVLKDVPGFYIDKKGDWTLNLSEKCEGIIIPIMSLSNLIQGFQIRLDKPFKNTKYIWLSSSSLESGVSSGSPVHFVGSFDSNVAYVTEGSLKGDIANAISKRSFLCVAGVNQYNALDKALELLKSKGINTIVEAYDMDKYTNENVKKGSLKLIEKANELGFKVHRLKWNNNHKGIDDFLLYTKNKKQKEPIDGL